MLDWQLIEIIVNGVLANPKPTTHWSLEDRHVNQIDMPTVDM